jgi:hypothetical protein
VPTVQFLVVVLSDGCYDTSISMDTIPCDDSGGEKCTVGAGSHGTQVHH